MLYNPSLKIRLICRICRRLGLYPAVPEIINDLPQCCGVEMLICGLAKRDIHGLAGGGVIDPADNLSMMEMAA